jgi:hypothetical protein
MEIKGNVKNMYSQDGWDVLFRKVPWLTGCVSINYGMQQVIFLSGLPHCFVAINGL